MIMPGIADDIFHNIWATIKNQEQKQEHFGDWCLITDKFQNAYIMHQLQFQNYYLLNLSRHMVSSRIQAMCLSLISYKRYKVLLPYLILFCLAISFIYSSTSKLILKKTMNLFPTCRLHFLMQQIVIVAFYFPIINICYSERMGCQSSQMVAPTSPSPIDQTPFQKTERLLASSKSIGGFNFQEAERLADQFFKEDKIVEAIRLYQKMIQEGYSVSFGIEGVGNAELSISRYEWFIYRWYDEQRKAGKLRGNAFDALSLCYNIIRNSNEDETERGILWYEDMLGLGETVELLMGYANILYNRGRYEEAIKAYNKVIDLRPSLVNAYVAIALTYEYRRIQKPKSTAMATRILGIDPQNMYAHFILARNEADVDVKIAKLKLVSQKFPEYVRTTNDIGIAYGGTKKEYRQAITWYLKCTQITPEYASCYNNIGVNHQLLKEYEQALKWYFRACEYDHEYKTAHVNASDIFDTLNYDDIAIFEAMKPYPKLDRFMFYYYLGLAYYDKRQNQKSIKWYTYAMGLNNSNHKLMNSMGITYDEMKDFANGEKYYKKCIQANPKYHSAYYNLAILFKNHDNVDEAIVWYKKAIEVNPRYSYAYNNLGNIYKNRQEYQKAIDCYKSAVDNLSTYTLALANMAICLLQLEKYQEAFAAFQRAKEILPTDNNNLSESNKAFLKENLEKFDKEGQKWRKMGSINKELKETLKSLIKSFESNFKQLYSSQASLAVNDAKALRPQILQIVNRIYDDKFSLKSIDQIFSLVKHIFIDDEEYFHIIPQIFIQYFWSNTFSKGRPILDIQNELMAMTKVISNRQSSSNVQTDKAYNLNFKLKYFTPSNECKVNLFKDTAYFGNYEILYSEIDKVNKEAEQALPEFIDFVDAVRKRSNGIPYGVNMKLPKDASKQFKVILRILEKMFKKEIDDARVHNIISKIDTALKKGDKEITLVTIVHEIMEVWTKEITLILEERSKSQTETTCTISDLVRGKIMFNDVDDLAKAIDACDKICHLRGYQILELDNRLSKPQTMDVVLKIKINEAVCEFQLAMRQDESKYHLIHSIYEIERSPLGCIFGSYLFMSKGFAYPFLANCKDIEARLKPKADEESKKTVLAAQYIINALQEKKVKR